MDGVFTFFGVGGATSKADSPDSLAMQAMDDYNRGEYSDALKTFEEIKERFPFSPHSLLAELKAADCNYFLKHYPEAVALYQGFEGNHPTNEAMPYVLFQIGMAYYQQIDTIDRDPGAALDAIAALEKQVKAFPNSPYRAEADGRRLAALNFLANHEFSIAMFYIRTNELAQAEPRLRYLLDNYPDTLVAKDAKTILADIKAGKPPQRTWRDWVPDLSLPDWRTFTTLSPVGVSNSSGGQP
jgi:outer membrane protein assembly factor BamD